MGAPRSVRLSDDVAERLGRLVRRSRSSTSSVIERLLDEALRMDAHPRIFFQDGPVGRRPKLFAGPDVWEVISGLWDNRDELGPGASTDELLSALVETSGLPEVDVRAAISYYAEFTEEIDGWITSNRDLADEMYAAWLREQEVLAGPAA